MSFAQDLLATGLSGFAFQEQQDYKDKMSEIIYLHSPKALG